MIRDCTPALFPERAGNFFHNSASIWMERSVNTAMPRVTTEDLRLIDSTLAGQSEAFGALVEKYQDRLYHSMLRLTGSPEEARDVGQDAFVQAFVKLKTFRGSSNFYTWLYRIAFNLAMTERRRNRPVISLDQTRDLVGTEPEDRADRPDQHLAKQDQAKQVRQALQRLGEEHSAVLVLREIEDFSYDVISRMLDLPVGTVRSRLHRARIQMKEEMERILK